MTKVTVNNTDYSDDGSSPNDMLNGGWRKHLLRMISDLLVEMSNFLGGMANLVGIASDHSDEALHQAQAAAASAASALNAPGTNGTSSSNMIVGLGAKTLVMQPGKEIRKGAQLMIAATASPRDWMAGTVTQYDSATGETGVWVTNIGQKTPGVFLQAAAWTISLTGAPGGSGVTNEMKGDTIASAATIDLDNVTGNLLHVSGVEQIGAATLLAGRRRTLIFDGVTRLVHSANFQLPGGLDVITAPGDMVVVYGDGGNKVLLNNYTKATGAANMSSGILAKSGDVAVGANVDMLTHQALQLLTPIGLGASLKLAPANQLVPAIAAAYASNRSATYQLGIRNNSGVLLAALQPKTDLPLTLTDTSSAAGEWTWGAAIGGVEAGLLLTQEISLLGGQLKSYVLNQPSSVASVGETASGYSQFLTFLSQTLAIAIMYNSSTTTWSLIALNPKTGAVSPPLVVSTSVADDCFRIEPLSASTFAVLWIANANTVNAATNCRVATVNTATMIMGFNGSAVAGPAAGSARLELNTLRLSSGVVVAVQASRPGSAADLTAFVISGGSITATGALAASANGLQQNCYISYSSLHEIAPGVFAIPTAVGFSAGFVNTFSVNVATGVLAVVASFMWTLAGTFGGSPGTATMVNFPGTSYWMVAAQSDYVPQQMIYAHLVSISATGAVSFVGAGGATTFNYGQASGLGSSRFTIQAFGPGQVLGGLGGGTGVIGYRATGYNAATGQLTTLASSAWLSSSVQIANPNPGTYYASQEQVGSSLVVKVTWNGVSFVQSTMLNPANASRFQYGAKVGASIVGVTSSLAFDIRSTGKSSVATMASSAGSNVRPSQVDSAGSLAVVTSAFNNMIYSYEVAQ